MYKEDFALNNLRLLICQKKKKKTKIKTKLRSKVRIAYKFKIILYKSMFISLRFAYLSHLYHRSLYRYSANLYLLYLTDIFLENLASDFS